MSIILDALKRSDRDKRLSMGDIGSRPWHWDGWPSGQHNASPLIGKIRSSVLPYVKMLMMGALALTLSSAVTWASMAYFNDSDRMTVKNGILQAVRNDVDGGINNSTTAGNDVSPAKPVGGIGLSAFLSDGMDQTREGTVGEVREEQRKRTGVEYRAAIIEEDSSTSATPAIKSPLEEDNEDEIDF